MIVLLFGRYIPEKAEAHVVWYLMAAELVAIDAPLIAWLIVRPWVSP